jgi:inosose dehydratase
MERHRRLLSGANEGTKRMTISIGNAPCSWGVEFAGDPRNPTWQSVLSDCAAAGYKGIELGPVGFMPEDPAVLADGLAQHDLALIGGVVFQPFHDPDAWSQVMDSATRTCKSLVAHGAQHLVLIDSISPRRAPTAGRATEAEQMVTAEWTAFRDRIAAIAKMGAQDYGLTVGIHAHAAGFMDFEPELERLLDEVDEDLLKICFDTGHHSYAGFDPVAFMKRHIGRISYMHFKDIDPKVKADVIARRTGFYDACGQGIFCNLGQGDVDFPAVRQILLDAGFEGWCTVEQDCDPTLDPDPIGDARANRAYLSTIGF